MRDRVPLFLGKCSFFNYSGDYPFKRFAAQLKDCDETEVLDVLKERRLAKKDASKLPANVQILGKSQEFSWSTVEDFIKHLEKLTFQLMLLETPFGGQSLRDDPNFDIEAAKCGLHPAIFNTTPLCPTLDFSLENAKQVIEARNKNWSVII